MKIQLVTFWVFPHVGGVSTHLQLLARKLGIEEGNIISSRHIHIYGVPGIRGFRLRLERRLRQTARLETSSLQARTLTRLLVGTEADIVHCHDAMATWAAIRARARSGKRFKVVSTVHGPYSSHMVEEGFPPSSPDVAKVARCEREAWCGSDAIIAVDEGQARIAVEQGADPGKVRVVPNAVDIAALDKLAAALPISRGSSRPWVLVPRRLFPKNGVDVAVRAMAQMAERPLLLLAGSGPERERLEGLVRQFRLQNDVVFLGALDHAMMIPMVATADVVAIPSVPVFGIEEATSLAALEAMALRRPVVASALGGLCELIRDGVNGVLVQPGDRSGLATALERLMKDGGLRTRLGREARRVVETEFDADLWWERHFAIYRWVLGPGAANATAGGPAE